MSPPTHTPTHPYAPLHTPTHPTRTPHTHTPHTRHLQTSRPLLFLFLYCFVSCNCFYNHNTTLSCFINFLYCARFSFMTSLVTEKGGGVVVDDITQKILDKYMSQILSQKRLKGKVEGRGEKYSTWVDLNLVKGIGRTPGHLRRYIEGETGWKITEDTENEGCIILPGARTDKCINALLKKFIQTFVQCPSCGYCHTQLRTDDTFDDFLARARGVKRDLKQFLLCQRCGKKSSLESEHHICEAGAFEPLYPLYDTKPSSRARASSNDIVYVTEPSDASSDASSGAACSFDNNGKKTD